MVDAAADADRRLDVGFHLRYKATARAAREAIAAGRLGEVFYAEMACGAGKGLYPYDTWRADPSALGRRHVASPGRPRSRSGRVPLRPADRGSHLHDRRAQRVRTCSSAVPARGWDAGEHRVTQPHEPAPGPTGRYSAPGVARRARRLQSGTRRRARPAHRRRNQPARHIDGVRLHRRGGRVLRRRWRRNEPIACGIDGLRAVAVTDALYRSAAEGRRCRSRRLEPIGSPAAFACRRTSSVGL